MMNWEAMCLRVAPSERRNPISRQAYWRGTHGPIGAAIPTMSRYVQSHTCLGAYGRATPPPFDGLAITWWEGLDAMRASAETAEYQATRDDEPNFIGVDPAVILTTEHVIVWLPVVGCPGQERAGDHQLLDLARALADDHQRGIPIETLDAVLGGEAVAAMNAHGV